MSSASSLSVLGSQVLLQAACSRSAAFVACLQLSCLRRNTKGSHPMGWTPVRAWFPPPRGAGSAEETFLLFVGTLPEVHAIFPPVLWLNKKRTQSSACDITAEHPDSLFVERMLYLTTPRLLCPGDAPQMPLCSSFKAWTARWGHESCVEEPGADVEGTPNPGTLRHPNSLNPHFLALVSSSNCPLSGWGSNCVERSSDPPPALMRPAARC